MTGCVMLEDPKIVDDGTGWSRIGDLIWSSWNLEAKMMIYGSGRAGSCGPR